MKVDPLFKMGQVRLHSGEISNFKIECEALTDEDWETLAMIVHDRYPRFGYVRGVARGGLKLADALEKYKDPAQSLMLLVDDVLTTGASITALRDAVDYPHVVGVVIFARSEPPGWVQSVFTMWQENVEP